MFEVIIRNEKLNKYWRGLASDGNPFPTRKEAESWLNKQIGKPGRLPEREIPTYNEEGNVAIDEEGNPIMEVLPQEYSASILDVSIDQKLEQSKNDAKELLLKTDWYVIRFVDSGVEIPSDIKQKREEARKIL